MAKTDFKSVAEYIAAQPKKTASVLKKVRSLVKKALPDAEEIISYQIPAYKVHGRDALYFAGYDAHFSLYPASAAVLREVGDAAKTHLANKATLRFSLDEPLPAKLIERVAKARAREVAEIIAAKMATRKKAAPKRTPRKTASRKTTRKSSVTKKTNRS